MRTVGELLEREDFRLDLAAHVVAWAEPNGADAAATALYKRKVKASETVRRRAVDLVRQAAVTNGTVKAHYEASETDGTWDPADIAFITDTTLDAFAAVAPTDFDLIGRALRVESTIEILTGYAPRAANAVLADPDRAPHVKRFAREIFGDTSKIREWMTKHAGHILTTNALLPYDGEIAGATDQELNAAFGAFLDNWAEE